MADRNVKWSLTGHTVLLWQARHFVHQPGAIVANGMEVLPNDLRLWAQLEPAPRASFRDEHVSV